MTMAGAPEILVYKIIFKDKTSCQRVYQDKPQPLINELSRIKPQAKRMSFKCVDRQTLIELKRQNKIKNL
jgi:hypothetical protein